MKIWAVSQENRLAVTWRNTLLVLNVKHLPVLKCKHDICLSVRDEIHKELRPCSAAIPGCSTPSIPACLIWSGYERTNREVNPNGSQRGPGRPCTIHTSGDQAQRSNIVLGLLVDEINVNWSVSFLPILLQGCFFCQLES